MSSLKRVFSSLSSIGKANFLHSKSSFIYLMVYLLSGTIIFGICTYFGLRYQDMIYDALLSYFFPGSWHAAADLLVNFFFESQSKVVVAAMLSSGALVLASILLFPVKERCSALYEKALGSPNGVENELPLWMQAVEESKLLLFYITSQMVILAIGYYPFISTKILSEILSVIFLSFTFGVDFIAPTLQRHGIKYNIVLRLLFRRFFSTLCWGAVFGLPVLYIGQFLLINSELTLIEVSAYVFALSIIVLSLAIAPGTYLASSIYSEAADIPPLSFQWRRRAYIAIFSLFTAGVIFHASVLMSIHHKSQVLKMHYSIDWEKTDFKMDSLFTILKDQGDISISFPLRVTNPTEFDFEIEDSVVVLKQNDRQIAHMKVSHLSVPSGETLTQVMHTSINISGSSVSGYGALMSGWTAVIEYEVLPGIPLIVKII